MGWREEQEERNRKIGAELYTLVKSEAEEDLNKRFFKNFGCINFRSEEFFHELFLARAYHAHHAKLHPELHDLHETTPYSCYHVTKCKCGFREECDSGD